MEWFTAPSIDWRWLQKHSHTVNMASIDQKDFTLNSPRLQIHWPWNTHHSRKTSKKRSRAVEWPTAPPINYRWVLKTLTDCAQDIHWPNAFHPDTHRLQIHWPGIHITAKRLQRKKAPEKKRKGKGWIWSLGKHFKLVARESNEKSKHRNKRLQKDESEFKLMKGRMWV